MRCAALARPQLLAGLLAATCLAADAGGRLAIPAGEYDLTSQTVLPHLEEALRYATTRARRCLSDPEASDVFPLLRHPAFAGCNLVPEAREAIDGLHFSLHCTNPEAASGAAAFAVEGGHLSATLEIKMGGKNMTLSQRLHGSRVGPCQCRPQEPAGWLGASRPIAAPAPHSFRPTDGPCRVRHDRTHAACQGSVSEHGPP